MDLSFIDSYQESTPPEAKEAQSSEIKDLINVAENIPLLHWNYNNVDVPDTGEKLGLITQALLKVPGLASMVSTDENGIQNYDSGLLAGAALSLVAALARHVLNIDLREDYADESRTNVEPEGEQGNEPTADNTSEEAIVE